MGEKAVLTVDGLQALMNILASRGYRVIGPTIQDQAIVYDDVRSLSDLPRGWSDEQDGGHYRLVRRDDEAMFAYAVGPYSWKKFLHPPEERLWKATRHGQDVAVTAEPISGERFAFIGVRSCELHAIAIQDRVFLGGDQVDPRYEARRRGSFFVAVNCSYAAEPCFCVSMRTGPRAETGFDLALTEIVGKAGHIFVVEAGTALGREIIAEVSHGAATEDNIASAQAVVAATAANMKREIDADGVQELLLRNLEHPRWEEVAERCLTCGNCTSVCPTCFCTNTQEASDPGGNETARMRRWDSCFTLDFSYIHGGSVRSSTRSRYRQWMTHKLATWHDQFGTSGCVGCGRCITWCPVGIDITEEVRAIAEAERGRGE